MAEKSKIEWCEKSWNVTGGCSKVSDGCRDCWAEFLTATRFRKNPRYDGLIKNGHWSGKVKLFEDRLEQPLHWRDPSLIFVNSQSDLFHPAVPFEFIAEVYLIAQKCPQHTFQILTKRIERAKEFYEWDYPLQLAHEWGQLKNVWLGVTCENQKTADERIPILLQIPAAVRFVSCEPLLESIDFKLIGKANPEIYENLEWLIVGCESGANRRPCKLEWVRSIVRQCQSAGVPPLVKQLPLWSINRKSRMFETAQEAKLHFGKVKVKQFVVHDIKQFPKDLQVRNYPKMAS